MGVARRLGERLRTGAARAGRRFARSERGNVAVMAALSIVSITVITGGAIDVYRFESQRKRVQAVFDRCVLSVARLGHSSAPPAAQTRRTRCTPP